LAGKYHLRQVLTGINAELLVRPEIFVTSAAQKFTAEALELSDKPTLDLVRQQLATFEKFVRRITGRA
jgi:hypothetical protein